MTPPGGQPAFTSGDPVDFDRLVTELEEGVLQLEEGYIVGANPALARLIGVPPRHLLGRRVAECFASTDGRPVHALVPGDATRVRDSRGELLPVSVRAAGPGCFLVIDRSRERRLEREVWRLAEELRRLGHVEHGFPSQEEVLGMIEHEIRTATTVVRGYTRMLLDERVGAVNGTQRSFLVEARRGTERITALLDNLLELASLECQGALRVVRRRERLHDVLASALEQALPLLAERRIRAETALAAPEDAILGDAARLQQVIVNLLANAGKFAPEGSVVRVETAAVADAHAICVSIQDEGPGVSSEEAERIFRPFVQGRAAAAAGGGGVGLGLAICQRIVLAHDGSIEAIGGAGRGVFRVRLPLVE
jgi:signal transduction histidine kinase